MERALNVIFIKEPTKRCNDIVLLRNTERVRATRAATSAARRSPDLIREGDWRLVAKIFGAREH